MKHFIYSTLAVCVFAACFTTSCSKDESDAPKSYPVTVDLNLKDGLTLPNLSNLKLIATNTFGKKDTFDISSGKVSFKGIASKYTFDVSGKVKDEAAAYASGSLPFNVFQESNVTIEVNKILKSPLLFKEIFTAGARKRYMKDGYFEIVNNSDEMQYLDKLILFHAGRVGKSKNAWQSHGILDLYPSSQGCVIAFPGSGQDYPIQPGESVVVANDAANHKTLAPSGETSEVDLSNAPWEVYLDYAKEQDYPAKNMEVVYTNNKNMKAFGLGVMGGVYILAKLPDNISPLEYASDKRNFQTTPGTTSPMEFMMMSSKYVLDAVQIKDPEKQDAYPVLLPKDDKGFVNQAPMYSGKCVRRKVLKVENGRAYYKDTNNSTEDFLTDQTPAPGKKPLHADI